MTVIESALVRTLAGMARTALATRPMTEAELSKWVDSMAPGYPAAVIQAAVATVLSPDQGQRP